MYSIDTKPESLVTPSLRATERSAAISVGKPVNGMVELAGLEPIRLDELGRRYLNANRDARKVTTDVRARYISIEVNDQSLTPGKNPRLGSTRFDDWLNRSIPQR